jgi:hypothetical protein
MFSRASICQYHDVDCVASHPYANAKTHQEQQYVFRSKLFKSAKISLVSSVPAGPALSPKVMLVMSLRLSHMFISLDRWVLCLNIMPLAMIK